MKQLTITAALLLLAPLAMAQNQMLPPCPDGTISCTQSAQNMGDLDNSSSANNSHSAASQSNNSTSSIAAGNTIAPSFDNKTQTTQNATNTTTGTISGGNTTSGATGGNAIGNTSDNKSSATTGASTSNASTGASTAAQGQGQGQGQALIGGDNTLKGGNQSLRGGDQALTGGNQGQGQGQTSTNAVTGGNQSADTRVRGGDQRNGQSSDNRMRNGDQDNSGGNSAVNIDGSDRSSYTDNSRFTVIPQVVPGTPPSVMGVGQISTVVGACGPRQRVVQVPVEGFYFGFTHTKRLTIGQTDTLEPVLVDGVPSDYRRVTARDGTVVLMGSQPIFYTTIVGVSGARNLALGGGSSSGGWGQAGGGASSAMQQLVTRIILRECEAGRITPPAPPIQWREAPASVEPAPLVRRRVKALPKGCPPVSTES